MPNAVEDSPMLLVTMNNWGPVTITGDTLLDIDRIELTNSNKLGP